MAMKWKKEKILGAGTFGSVYLATPMEDTTSSATLAAVKSAEIGLSSTLQKERMFLGELQGEPNIVRCFGEDTSIEGDQEVYNLLLEYAPGGSLHDLIKNNKGNIPESHVACYTSMILKGLCAIHENETIHRDLKPSNILVFPNADGTQQLKIADFGLAKKVWEAELPEWGRMGFNNGCTLMYASPESVTCGLVETASDIWSLGCIVVEMVTGEPIWSCSRSELLHKLVFERPKIPENLSDEGKDFLTRCFERSLSKRWTAEELLDHPFIIKNLKFLDGSRPQVFSDQSQMTPFGIGDSISTRDLFSTSSLDTQCVPRASYNPVAENGPEEYQRSCCLPTNQKIQH